MIGQIDTFSMDTIEKNGVSIITPDFNRVDATNSDRFYADLDSLASGRDKVVLNMKQITFVDSSGLGRILSFAREIHKNNGTLFLSNVAPTVRILFKAVRLDKIVPIYPQLDDAIAAFEQ